ncbi:MAG: hypothetical protein AB8B63_10720 [Granulosicoccus sp.]
MRQDVSFSELARALATAPGVLLLDEPAAGLMRADKQAVSSVLKQIAGLGIAVVLVADQLTAGSMSLRWDCRHR